MASYRVCFINQIPRGPELFRCCQRSIVIRKARSPERAMEAAKKRFARLEAIRDWKIHAEMIEMQEIDLTAPANGSTPPHQFLHAPPSRCAPPRHPGNPHRGRKRASDPCKVSRPV
jgi:hypothetical protein